MPTGGRFRSTSLSVRSRSVVTGSPPPPCAIFGVAPRIRTPCASRRRRCAPPPTGSSSPTPGDDRLGESGGLRDHRLRSRRARRSAHPDAQVGRARAGLLHRALACVTGGETWSGTIVNRRKDGTLYHEEQTIAPVLDAGAGHSFRRDQGRCERPAAAEEALATANQELAARVAEIESLNEQLRERAIRDPLTGLHNRRYFDGDRRARRGPRRPRRRAARDPAVRHRPLQDGQRQLGTPRAISSSDCWRRF